MPGEAIEAIMVCFFSPDHPFLEEQPATMKNPLPFLALGAMLAVIPYAQLQLPSGSLPLDNADLSLANSASASAEGHFDGKSWWNYVKVLANDNMEGRETGSFGVRMAQDYVVEHLKRSGLEPVGSKGFYQPVQFVSRQIVEKESSLALVHNGQTEPLTLGDDAIFSTRVDLAPALEAPLAFAGYGLNVPESNYNDLAGLDLQGKVAVVFSGSPEEISGALASHYQSAGERWKAMYKAGAVGIITIPNPASMDIPWSRISANLAHPSMAVKAQEFNVSAGEQLAVTFNPARAETLFEGSGHTLQEILDAAKARKQLPRFPLAVSIKAKAAVSKKDVESANLIAQLPGADPKLKSEYVVLSAHLDHLGIGEPINGDRIYNGAMDNASGSAVLLDMAASLKKSSK